MVRIARALSSVTIMLKYPVEFCLSTIALATTVYALDGGKLMNLMRTDATILRPMSSLLGPEWSLVDKIGKPFGIEVENHKWRDGVLLCLLASTLSSLGIVIQKYAHNQSLEEAKALQSSSDCSEVEVSNWRFYFRSSWIGGFLIWIIAQFLNMCAMGLAPQTMLSCFGSWTIICNVLIARVILGELISTGECLGLLGILMGVVFVILGAPRTFLYSGDVRLLASQFISPSFILLTLGVAALLFALHSYLCPKEGTLVSRGLFWAICSAVLSGYSALLFKCVSLMALHVPDGAPSPWNNAEAYVITSCAILVGIVEIHALNLGLKHCQAVVLVPVYLLLGMLAQITTNGVFFKEFSQFASKLQIALFIIGVALSIIFVASLFIIRARYGTSFRRHATDERPDDSTVLKKVESRGLGAGAFQTTSSHIHF